MHLRIAFLSVGLSAACAGPAPDPNTVVDNGQTYRAAIGTLCEVDAALDLGDDADVLEVADRRHEYFQAHVKHPDGIYFYTLFRTQGPKEQSQALRTEAREVGLTSCSLADTLAAEAAEDSAAG